MKLALRKIVGVALVLALALSITLVGCSDDSETEETAVPVPRHAVPVVRAAHGEPPADIHPIGQTDPEDAGAPLVEVVCGGVLVGFWEPVSEGISLQEGVDVLLGHGVHLAEGGTEGTVLYREEEGPTPSGGLHAHLRFHLPVLRTAL